MPRGGARPGAGRKPKVAPLNGVENQTPASKPRVGGRPPKPPVLLPSTTSEDPLAFLMGVMNDGVVPLDLRIKAATSAAQYTHAKKGEGGKKQEQEAAALEAQRSQFAPSAPPTAVRKRNGAARADIFS